MPVYVIERAREHDFHGPATAFRDISSPVEAPDPWAAVLVWLGRVGRRWTDVVREGEVGFRFREYPGLLHRAREV